MATSRRWAGHTTYTYHLTSPAWTDPTGSYTASLDKFDRATAVNDPVNASDFTWSYRADGQPASFGQPNGNTTAYAYDATGRLVSKDTTAGATDRALYDWTHNRAGQILTEASTVTGDASNGTVTYAYDPLERLTSATLAGTTTAYGWDAVPNRTSVQVGAGTPATTTYDAANRPTSGANPTATYTNDDDGRLTARPGQRFEWDRLGRLVRVRPATGNSTIATYTYDPLDRLRLVDYGGNDRTRFRYVGLSTSVAQLIADASGTVTRHVANGWRGERLADWTGGGSDLRLYGTNGHHDVTWLAGSTGTVAAALRYDPWGAPRSTVPSGYTPFRFQGAWHDATTDISWVITRWYAPALGRFISEDSLLGEPVDPPSRHLYAYGEGEPVGRWDPDGRYAYATGTFPNPKRLRGKLEIGLFIKDRYNEAPMGITSARLYGDHRGFSSGHVDCTSARGCIKINFETNSYVARVNDTCGDWLVSRVLGIWAGHGCNAAFGIRQSGLTTTDKWNLVRVRTADNGRVDIKWDITQSRLFIIRPDFTVNGFISVYPATASKGTHMKFWGEGFPSEEVLYYTRTGRRVVLSQHSEGAWIDMADWLGSWSTTKSLPST